MEHNIIEVKKLTKEYPGGTKAVRGVTFSVKEGEFFGFLGPNGAGKSTTMNMLVNLVKKTSGEIRIGSGGGNGTLLMGSGVIVTTGELNVGRGSGSAKGAR